MAEKTDCAGLIGATDTGHGDTLPRPNIKGGIELFDTGLGYEDCQCARCGSSCAFIDCDNCGGEGEIEDDDWQCEGEFYRCDWCRGAGGWWHCLSGRDWCQANPMPGREDQPVTALEEADGNQATTQSSGGNRGSEAQASVPPAGQGEK